MDDYDYSRKVKCPLCGLPMQGGSAFSWLYECGTESSKMRNSERQSIGCKIVIKYNNLINSPITP